MLYLSIKLKLTKGSEGTKQIFENIFIFNIYIDISGVSKKIDNFN